MEKAILNSYVINDNHNVYYSYDNNFFELISFRITDNLMETIWSIVRRCLDKYAMPPELLIIPFVQYNYFICKKDEIFPGWDMFSLDHIIKNTTGYDIKTMVVVPDYLKDRVKPVI